MTRLAFCGKRQRVEHAAQRLHGEASAGARDQIASASAPSLAWLRPRNARRVAVERDTDRVQCELIS